MFHSAFEKDTEKVVLLEVKDLIKLLSSSGLKKFCVRSYHQTSFCFEGHETVKYWLRKQLCSFENKRLISFSYTIWFMILEKNITRCMLLHRDACMNQKSQLGIQKMWTSGFYWWTRVYNYRRRQQFQNILERKLSIALDSTEKC